MSTCASHLNTPNCRAGATPKLAERAILCDVYASELLLPYKLFKPLVDKADIGLAAVDNLAKDFVASVMATGSRFAAVANAPCAFVIIEQGKVRYASRSKALREANAWVQPRLALPKGSVCERLHGGGTSGGPEEIDAEVWSAIGKAAAFCLRTRAISHEGTRPWH